MSKTIPLKTNENRELESFPDFKNLLDGWFHQDFDVEGSELEMILQRFADASPLGSLRRTIQDVGRFIGIYGKDDAILVEAVERILKPEVILEGWEGMTTRQWLLRVAELLERNLQSKSTLDR